MSVLDVLEANKRYNGFHFHSGIKVAVKHSLCALQDG